MRYQGLMQGRVLIIAGSDPSGGAGVQADIKTVTALGGYAASAITALTVQNTLGVAGIFQAPADLVRDQINAVIHDIGFDAVKIGMLGSAEAVDAVADALDDADAPIVLDPVLVATSGDALASDGVVGAVKRRLIPICAVITPNAPEARALTGATVEDMEGGVAAGRALVDMGAGAALVKGGHLDGDVLTDVLVMQEATHAYSHARIETRNTHGTGCTLASALATRLAQGADLETAAQDAIDYVRIAIETAPGFGAGAGPLNHAHTVHSHKIHQKERSD
ncbi:MAG: bifunctional hydroxymethylpyrimidine kinase/phosphomethylpyrimidine kinase [Pseudomonadota bacterium]